MKVTLYNIQGHHKSSFKIKKGINVIVGPTDAGKSTIIRALRWLVFNRPASAGLKRIGSSKTYVEVETIKGDVVRREVSKSKNLYVLNGKELKSFGTGVPVEVQEALGLEDYNFKFQHDGFFLLSESGPERVRVINRFLDMDRITKATKAVAAKIRESRAEVQALGKIEKDVEEKILSMSEKEKTAIEILASVEVMNACVEVSNTYNNANLLLSDIKAIRRSRGPLKEAVASLTAGLLACERLIGRSDKLDEAKTHLAGLKVLQKEMDEIKESARCIQDQIDKMDLSRCKTCGSILGV